jgi:transcriptional regulator with XRE-family HTH domain
MQLAGPRSTFFLVQHITLGYVSVMAAYRLGQKVKAIRSRRGLTQVELAAKAGLTQGYLTQLERGIRTNPSLDILQRLAKALKVKVGELLG